MNEKQRQALDIRIKKGKEKLLEILKEHPIRQIAFKRSGVSKPTFHRWMLDDPEFAKNVEDAIAEGRSLMVDVAEANLYSLAGEKHFPAIKLVLDRFHKDFKVLAGPEKSKHEIIPDENNLKILFRDKPVTMHEIHSKESIKWPKVIKQAFAQIWSGNYSRIIIKAPRGGGKSKLLGTIGFDLWYLRNRKVINMGGSAVQAQIVYQYFTGYCYMHSSVEAQIEGRPHISKTTSIDGNYFSSVAASPKQIRGPHPDVLISDETCESDDELIHAALPMVNDSENPLVVMASTFHKIYGIFQETWDNAEERGYLRIQWDIFDIAKKFSLDFWKQPEVAQIPDIQKLIKLSGGKTGDPEGWLPIENIIQAWKEKPTEDWFEIEYMGSRPSAAGLVLKPEDIERAIFDSSTTRTFDYISGSTVVIGIDWGFSSMTSVVELMQHKDQTVVMLDNENFHQIPSEDIIKSIVKRVRARGVRFIYADSAGKFENTALIGALAKENIGCSVVEVVFSKEKEGMLGNLRAHFEQGKIKMAKKFKDAYWQFKRYRYQEGTDKPVKKDDHIPDATMCALQHFVLGKFARPFPSQTIPKDKGDDKPITSGLRNMRF